MPKVPKEEILQIRVSEAEKSAFVSAAEIAGISMSSWTRERLRAVAAEELARAGQRAPFLPAVATDAD